jgi:hypothetical protein
MSFVVVVVVRAPKVLFLEEQLMRLRSMTHRSKRVKVACH